MVNRGLNVARKRSNSAKLRSAGAVIDERLHPSPAPELAELAKAVNRLADIVENGFAQTIAALHARDAKPSPTLRQLAKGDRVKLAGRRGKVATVGAAGVSVQWDNGGWDMMLHPQAAKLVRE